MSCKGLSFLLHDVNCEASLSVFQPLAESEHKWLFDTLPKNLVSSLSRHSFSNHQQRYRWDRKVLCDIRAYFQNNSILNPLKKSKLRLGTQLSFLWNSCEFCTNRNLNVTSATKFQNSFAVQDLSVCPYSGFVGQFEISHNLIFYFLFFLYSILSPIVLGRNMMLVVAMKSCGAHYSSGLEDIR